MPNLVQIEPFFEQIRQWRVIEQGDRRFAAETSQNRFKQPARPCGGNSDWIRAIYLVRPEIAPHQLQAAYCAMKIVRTRRNRDRIDRARRRAANDRERVGNAMRKNMRQCAQNADLIGSASPASGQHQSGVPLLGWAGSHRAPGESAVILPSSVGRFTGGRIDLGANLLQGVAQSFLRQRI